MNVFSSAAVSGVSMDSVFTPALCVVFRMYVNRPDKSSSLNRRAATSLGRSRLSCSRRTTSRSSGSAMRPTIARYSSSLTRNRVRVHLFRRHLEPERNAPVFERQVEGHHHRDGRIHPVPARQVVRVLRHDLRGQLAGAEPSDEPLDVRLVPPDGRIVPVRLRTQETRRLTDSPPCRLRSLSRRPVQNAPVPRWLAERAEPAHRGHVYQLHARVPRPVVRKGYVDMEG